jgi:hypothetical protein
MRRIIFTTLILASAGCFGQTKPVAHRSHSGNMRFMAESTGSDNLGWGGPNLTPTPYLSDSVLFLKLFPPPADSLTNFPYCNNPAIPADTLEKHFPFYTQAIAEDVQLKDTMRLNDIDTIGQTREELRRNDPEKNNNVLPFIEPGNNDNVSGWKPGYGTILFFALFMLITGAFIWVTNRTKIQQSA